MRLLGPLALAMALSAADGVVVNQTTGKPQPGATVTLYKLSEAGPEALDSVKSAEGGRWEIAKGLEGMGFLQTAFEGVTYTKMLRPGTPLNGLSLEVFASSPARSPEVKATNHMLLLEPAGDKLGVRESYFFVNEGKSTWNDPENGTLRFVLPVEPISTVDVNATGPNSMPLRRAAEKGKAPGEMKVDFPIKPGETRIDLAYTLPFTNPGQFKTRFLIPSQQTMIAVPNGVSVKGEGIVDKGREPTTQAGIYEVEKDNIDLTITGSGELSPREGEGGESGAPTIEQIHARPYEKLPLVLGLAFAILALGFVLLYRTEAKK